MKGAVMKKDVLKGRSIVQKKLLIEEKAVLEPFVPDESLTDLVYIDDDVSVGKEEIMTAGELQADSTASVQPSALVPPWTSETGNIFPPLTSRRNDDGDRPESGEAVDLLNAIVDYYHKKLFENREALEFLEKQGIKTPQLLSLFKIGYADGSLLSVIGENQKKELIETGILDEFGFEVFHNCLIFPLMNENEAVNGIYGYSIREHKGFYLNHGVFNIRSSKVYDEMILVSSPLKALKLIDSGLNNVQPCNDDYTLTDEHLKKLKDDRVKTVVLLLDDLNEKEALKLKERLILEGFAVKTITGKGLSGEALKEAVSKAEAVQVKNPSGLDVNKNGFGYVFAVGEVKYSVTNVKESFGTNLKVNIRVEYRSERFPDNVDLYSSRSRDSFSVKLSQKFGIEPKRIEKDLLLILDYLEEEQRKRLAPKEEKLKELTETERQIGLEFLKSPDLFDQVLSDMTLLGCVGEENNKLLVWLSGNTRLLPKQLSNFIQSPPSVGKSHILETYLKLMPSETVEWITSSSDQAFIYMPEENFTNKIFMMGEALHNETVEGYIRQMQSENKLSRNVVLKDPNTGELKTVKKVNKVQLVFMMTSTAMSVNRENLSRCIVMKMDDSREQTEKILAMQRHKSSYEGYLEEKHLVPKIIMKHIAAQRLLQRIRVFNPFEKYIKFPSFRSIARRGQPQFLGLIDSACLSRQMQKTPVEKTDHYTGEKELVYECDLTDYGIARKLFIDGNLLQQDDDLSSGVISLYEQIRKMVKIRSDKEQLRPEEISFIQSEVRQVSQLSAIAIRKYIQILSDYEYLQVVGGRRHGTRYSYRLREDKAIHEVDICSIIPSVDEIRKMMEADGYRF
jgi:hypothetical protein